MRGPRALARIDEQSSQVWLRLTLLSSVRDALDRDWILDIDASVKPLYGKHEGALIVLSLSLPCRNH